MRRLKATESGCGPPEIQARPEEFDTIHWVVLLRDLREAIRRYQVLVACEIEHGQRERKVFLQRRTTLPPLGQRVPCDLLARISDRKKLPVQIEEQAGRCLESQPLTGQHERPGVRPERLFKVSCAVKPLRHVSP